MAELGFRTVNEMIGQVDNLTVRENIDHWKYKNLDLSAILYKEPHSPYTTLYCNELQDHGLAASLDWKLLELAKPALEHQQQVTGFFEIKNTDRTVGTILSHEITKKYRASGLPDHRIHFRFYGTAGQSFGAFAARGLTLELEGDANDYFGKGLSGARLVIYPPKTAMYTPEDNSIIGNVAFYGATSGEAFIRGKAGERFCVRNSGAQVVVESIGDHGCEYMTGGQVLILGETGRNFAAGMSGGIAYVYDVKGRFHACCNVEMVDLDACELGDKNDIFTMLQKHFEYTGSTVAKFILDDLDSQLKHFVKVFPKDYKKVLQNKTAAESTAAQVLPNQGA
jgi:glutamate synthase (NADPH/NADH) large chain